MVFIRKRKIFLESKRYSGKGKCGKSVLRSAPYKSLKTEPEGKQEDGNGSGKNKLLVQDGEFSSLSLPGPSNQQSPEIETVKTKYETAKIQRLQDWSDLRDELFSAYIDSEFLKSNRCGECNEECQLYRCLDCSQWENLCIECLQRRHQFPHLHLFEAWRNEAFVGANLETPTWNFSSHSPCDTNYIKNIIVVDVKGRQHKRNFQFCKCESEAVTLIKFKLWPSTTKFPRLAFDMELLKWLYGLQIECQVSTKGFCEALKFRCSKHHRSYINFQVSDIYKCLMTETFSEFRHFFHRTEYPQNFYDKLDNGTQCPACFSTGTKIYSLDADFQLVRKASSGKQWEEPKFSNHFFLDQGSVDSFMETYNCDSGKPDVDCNEFQAGSQLRSKNKNKKLSETAIFGSTCRHEFPKYFFSLKHGERLGYAVYIIGKLLEERESMNRPIHIMYDIACSLESHLRKRNNQSMLQSVHFSIPIFHCYGHKMACQVLYSPRKTAGIGLTDGESLERLWSYLGRFSKITKEMSPENRVNLLTDGLIHYGQKIREKLGPSLIGKMNKAVSFESSSLEQLQDLLIKIGGVSNDTVLTWIEEEKQTTRNCTEGEVPLTEQEMYIFDLEKICDLREKVSPSEIERDEAYKKLSTSVKKREKKFGMIDRHGPDYKKMLCSATDKMRRKALVKIQTCVVERNFLLELMKKYARGQSIAIRLGRQLKKTVSKIHNFIKEYNDIGRTTSILPMTISFEVIKDISGDIWNMLNIQQSSDIPYQIKHQAVNLKSLACRSLEEKNLLKEEMKSTLAWYSHQHALLIEAFNSSLAGRRACIVKEGLHTETMLSHLYSCFCSLIQTDFTPPTFFFDIIDVDSTSSWDICIEHNEYDSDLEEALDMLEENDSDSDEEDFI